jgi:hypothetical protein
MIIIKTPVSEDTMKSGQKGSRDLKGANIKSNILFRAELICHIARIPKFSIAEN